MTETPLTRRTAPTRKVLLGLAALVIVVAGGVAVWTTTCPCNRMPGFMLLGDVQETPVTDWSFVNDIPLCQIQIYAGVIPHAVNLNCMATPDGELFLSCSGVFGQVLGQPGGAERARAPAPRRPCVPGGPEQGAGRGCSGPGLGGQGEEAAGARRTALQSRPASRRETARELVELSAALGR